MTNYSSQQTTSARPINLLIWQSADGVPQVPRHLFTATSNLSRRDYTELGIFKQQIEQNQEGLHHQPYTANRSNIMLYKSIFFAFAALFAVLGVLVIATTSSLHHVFFNFSMVFKSLIVLGCGALSLTSFFMALGMRTEREAVRHYVRMARGNLAKIYAQKRLKSGTTGFFACFGENQRKVIALKQMYHDARDKINERKEEAMHLVNRIATTQALDAKTKEMLYNQAIAEFNEKLTLLTHTFKHAALPHFNS